MSERAYRTALAIAGSDPSGGAGITADIRTFIDHGVLALTAITSVNAQNTVEFTCSQPVDPAAITAQLEAIFSDVPVDAIKIGMLGTGAQARAVASFLQGLDELPPIVIDPVLRSSSGAALLDESGIIVLGEALLGLATLVTPNRSEAAILAGGNPEAWARESPFAVLITGGDDAGDEVVDRFYGDREIRYCAPRIPHNPGVRGTGCTLSSAIAARLALGLELEPAIVSAQAYVRDRITSAVPLGRGRRVMVSGR